MCNNKSGGGFVDLKIVVPKKWHSSLLASYADFNKLDQTTFNLYLSVSNDNEIIRGNRTCDSFDCILPSQYTYDERTKHQNRNSNLFVTNGEKIEKMCSVLISD